MIMFILGFAFGAVAVTSVAVGALYYEFEYAPRRAAKRAAPNKLDHLVSRLKQRTHPNRDS